MCEITVESHTRVSENGHPVLYGKKYRGVLEESGRFRLLAYFAKRIPLSETQRMELPEPVNNLKDAA